MAQAHVERERTPPPTSSPQARPGPVVRATPVTREIFSAAFDRCFPRLYHYVSLRVNDRSSCERIVREVLASNIDLLVQRGDERHELSQLKSASDRLIGSESARSLSSGATRP